MNQSEDQKEKKKRKMNRTSETHGTIFKYTNTRVMTFVERRMREQFRKIDLKK